MKNWQKALINAVTDPQKLLEMLELDPALLEAAKAAAKIFPLKVPLSFIERMKKNDINDPLLLQVLPIAPENIHVMGYEKDPLREKYFNPRPGLLHKYHGRVLLTLTSTCGVNCRFCFRRHFPYENNNPGKEGWENTLEYIIQDNTITEVILSGGDPLIMNDTLLHDFFIKLAAISHLKRVRIHTRMPIVIPERITPELITVLSTTRLKTIMVTHCNHPQEINDTVSEAIGLCLSKNIVLLNQAVLLKNVNDNSDTLVALSEKLFEIGIQPYYLHLLDKVQGTAHFDCSLDAFLPHYETLKERLPGYLVPKLVCEQPHQTAKKAVFLEDFYTD